MNAANHDEHGGARAAIVRDLLASIVVFLVALPLCLGIAIASGAPPAAGLLTGVIGGLVVGFIGGAPLQVSGPAAGLAVIVWDLVQTHGFAALGPIVVVAGVVQIVAGVARLGRWFQAVPHAVVLGMLCGIGVLIFASQFHVMVDDAPRGGGLANLAGIPGAVWKGVIPHAGLPHDDAALIGSLTLVTILGWNAVTARWLPRAKIIPGTLVGILLATVVANVVHAPIAHVDMPDGLVANVQIPTAPTFAVLLDARVLGAALALAFVASTETLLCATATDRMHEGPRTKYDREMLAQGIGNTLAGLVGGLPMTGVIVRSSANIQAGATTRLSAIMHGAWLLAAIAAVPFVLRLVPVSALAALLVYTGAKLVRQDVRTILARGGRFDVAIFFVTVAMIVSTDLLKGVLTGLVLALGKVLWMLTQLRVRLEHDAEMKRSVLVLEGSATFLRLPALASTLAKIPAGHEVHVYVDAVNHIDHACYEALAAWEKQHVASGGRVHLDWSRIAKLGKTPPRLDVPATSS
ncbi:MAG: SulP family inorganic anion transporter [Labilithrix sp.]|nr:SulP family inorganic anion transporter [Labilithrix sp.]MCW5813046.1 SulP family inorganic anion transporter [Labilithrix sp.]